MIGLTSISMIFTYEYIWKSVYTWYNDQMQRAVHRAGKMPPDGVKCSRFFEPKTLESSKNFFSATSSTASVQVKFERLAKIEQT